MTKIKNFRITLRTRDMARWLKKERGMETTPELELALEQAAKDAKPYIETAALYTTLTRQIAEKTTTVAFPKKSIAMSVVTVSIGPALDAERQAAASDPTRAALLAAVHHEALGQSLQFVIRLIQDQAKEEDCEAVSPIAAPGLPASGQDLLTAPLFSSLATLLGIQRIGITLDAAAPEIPSHARVAWLFWTPIGKAAASRRAEKVAA